MPRRGQAPLRRQARERGKELEAEWNELLAALPRGPSRARGASSSGACPASCPDGWEDALPNFEPGDKPIATRAASGKVLNAIVPQAAASWSAARRT